MIFIKMWVCALAALLLAGSDLFINMSSSYVVGSTEESRLSAQLVAIGIVLGLMGLGSLAEMTENKLDNVLVKVVAFIGALFSGALTVQAMSIDYATNDQRGKIQNERQNNNDANIGVYQDELKTLKSKMAECERDRYFKPCHGTEKRIATLSDRIASINKDTTQSVAVQEVDITYAVEEKSGIAGNWMERAQIYSRAIAVPLMIYWLMVGFWKFFGQYIEERKKKELMA